MKPQFRWRLLAALLAGTTLLIVGVHVLHGWQVRRNAPALLAQADRAEQADNPLDAAFYLGLYLKRVPADLDARARHALLRVRLARTKKEREAAYQGLENVLRRAPDRDDVRREAIHQAMSSPLERYSDARYHLDYLLKDKADAKLELLFGRCWLAEKDFAKAAEHFATVIRLSPDEIDGYVLRALALRADPDKGGQGEKGKESPVNAALADQVMDELVGTVATPDAYLARAVYRQRHGSKADARDDVESAWELDPDHADALLSVAELHREDGNAEAARALLSHGRARHRQDARFYLALARLEVQAGRPDAAIACLRQGLEELPDRPSLLWDLALLLAESDRPTETRPLVESLHHAGVPAARLLFLEGRILAAQGRWREAVARLERARPQLQAWPDLLGQSDVLLGECQVQLGDLRNAQAAYRRAVSGNPLWDRAVLGLGAVLERLGQSDDAIEVYRRAIPGFPRARLLLVRLLYARNLTLPRVEQRWDPISELLDDAEKALPDAREEFTILRARILHTQGKSERALAMLAGASKEYKSVEAWVGHASFLGHCNKVEDALAMLTDARKKFGDKVEIRLACAELYARQGEPGRKRLSELERDADHFSEADTLRLWGGLAEAHVRIGDIAAAAVLYRRIAQARPSDLSTRMVLFDLALLREDLPELTRCIADIREIEGADGTFWRYGRACELVVLARKGDASGLPEARKLLGIVADRRPTWARVAVCEAEIAAVAGKRDACLARSQEAFRLGDRSLPVLKYLIVELYRAGRAREAEPILELLPADSFESRDLGRLAAEISLQTGNYDRALQLARAANLKESKDPADHMLLGHLHWRRGELDRAASAFKDATDMDHTRPAPWVARIGFLSRTGKKDEAIVLVKEAGQVIAPVHAPLALAQCHEALGQTDLARQLFDRALRERPGEAVPFRASIAFRFRSGDFAEAELLLEQMLKCRSLPSEDVLWARRTLARVLAFHADPARSRRALELVAAPAEGDTDDDARARALVLATRPTRADRNEGVRVLEGLARRQVLNHDDRFLLAQLYESVGKWEQARDELDTLVKAEPGNPLFLARRIRGLLRHGEAGKAAAELAKLKELQPDSFQTVELTSRALVAENRGDQAAQLLSKYAEKEGVNLPRVAQLLAELGQPKDAERVYRRWVGMVKTPEAGLVLAVFLARQNRLREALALCEEARKSLPPQAVVPAALESLYVADFDRTECERVVRWIEDLLQKAPKNASLITALGAVRSRQGEFEQAITLYRRALEQDANNALAMNNLAFLLALKQGQETEALDLLDRAETIAGPLPDLLDTRAVVLLRLGKPDRAAAILEDVVAVKPSAAGYFRLAQAHNAARERLSAQHAWQQANALGLKATDVHPLERPAFDKLSTELGDR